MHAIKQRSQIPIHDRRHLILHAHGSEGSHKRTSFISLLSANVEDGVCWPFRAFWAQVRDLPHCSRPTKGHGIARLGYHSGQLLEIRDAYSIAAWTSLYGRMYTWDYASAHGRYESCKHLTSTAYKINYSPFTRDHSFVRGRHVRYK